MKVNAIGFVLPGALTKRAWSIDELFVQSETLEAYRDPTIIQVPAESIGPQVRQGVLASVTGFRYIRAWAAEFVEFMDAINENRDPAVTGEDGVRVLEITDAVLESGRTGLPVNLVGFDDQDR